MKIGRHAQCTLYGPFTFAVYSVSTCSSHAMHSALEVVLVMCSGVSMSEGRGEKKRENIETPKRIGGCC